MGVRAQPILAVRDVIASARWYSKILGSAHETGSPPSDHDHIYRRIYVGETFVLQIHAWDEEDHPNLMNADRAPVGHGVIVWFEVDDYKGAAARARALGVKIIEEKVNPAAEHHEMWLYDPDGYVVVLASPDGTA